ncbi:MAG: hypothetical protein GY861_27160 [bacterium]|nr:hypothetical protein [bacterium]
MRSSTFLGIIVIVLITATISMGANQELENDLYASADLKDYLPNFLNWDSDDTDQGCELSFLEVSNITSSSAVVTWVSRESCEGIIKYGLTDELDNEVEDSSGLIHSIRLKGLPSGTRIYYQAYSGDEKSDVKHFRTSAVGAGIPKVVYGALPQSNEGEVRPVESDLIVKLKLYGSGNSSQTLSVKMSPSQMWMLNLGNLKAEDGQVFTYDEEMTAKIRIEGIGRDGEPEVLYTYKVKLSDAPDGNLSMKDTNLSNLDGVSSSWEVRERVIPKIKSQQVSPEREFLQNLLSKGKEDRLQNRKGHGHPHIIPGWRGGSKMGISKPPKPDPVPNRIHLRGTEVLKELVKLRQESPEAASFFPDVARHFPKLRQKLTMDITSVDLYEGINILALPLDPDTTVSSYGILNDVTGATVVTAWDGELQQFGETAIWIGENIVGVDFPFELGYGYFVTMDTTGQVYFDGDPVTWTKYITIHPGLDAVTLVGHPDTVTSYELLNAMFDGNEVCRYNSQLQIYQCAIKIGENVIGDEFTLEEGIGYFVRQSSAGYFPTDNTPPSITISFPTDSSEIHTKQPYIEIIFDDHETELVFDSLSIVVNGFDRTSYFTIDSLSAVLQMSGGLELPENLNLIEVRLVDINGNVRIISSAFNVVTTPPPADEHFVNGYVYDGETWEPMGGVAVTVDSIPGVIYTDSITGHYVFPTPGLGEYKIDFTKEHYAYAQRYVLIEDGHGDIFVDDAYLSLKDSVITRISIEGGVAVNSDGSVFSSFPYETVDDDIAVAAFNLDDAEDLPNDLPELSVFTYCVKFWPDEADFNGSTFIDQLNSRGFASGTPIPVGQYNPETALWEDEGMAYVQGDSSWFEWDLEKFMSYGDCNMPVVIDEPPYVVDGFSQSAKNDHYACRNNKSPSLGEVKLKFGGSIVHHNLPSFELMGEEKVMSFTYASHTAQPKIVIETGTAGIPPQFLLPQYTGAQVNVVGRRFTGIIAASRDTTRQRIRFDAKDSEDNILSSGLYYVIDALSNFSYSQYATAEYFGGPPIDSTGIWTDFPVRDTRLVKQNILIDNMINNAIGSGWSVRGIQRLNERPDGDVMIIDGDGLSNMFYRDSVGYDRDLAITSNTDSVFIYHANLGEEHTIIEKLQIGNFPERLVAADFNSDGWDDLAIVQHSPDNVSILLYCDSTNTYCLIQEFPTGSSSKGIVAEDFDDNGTMDIAVANPNANGISVLLNDGTGDFSNRTHYTVGDRMTGSISSGHFNDDGNIDLAVARGGYWTDINDATILFNDGLGGFSETSVVQCPNGDVKGLIAGDFNGDEFDDLAVFATRGGWYDGYMCIAVCNSQGDFSWIQGSYNVGVNASYIAKADFNGDGFIDIIVSRGYSARCFCGLGNGVFQTCPGISPGGGEMAIGDYNFDGCDDLAIIDYVNDRVRIYLNNGSGNLSQKQTVSVIDPMGITSFVYKSDYEIAFISQAEDPSRLAINSDSSGYTRIYPDGTQEIFDESGLHTATIDRNRNTTSYEYDEFEMVISITYPGSLVTHFDYGPDGKIETVTDPASRITHFDHDEDGNLISITDPDSSFWQYVYNDEHLLTKVIDSHGSETIYEYDSLGYVTALIGADSSTNDFLAANSYNTINEAIAQGYGTPESPAPVVYNDSLIDLFVNTNGDTTSSLTNAYGRRTQKIDALGRLWSFEYNENGLPIKHVRPDSTSVSMTWSEQGLLTSRTDDFNGATTTYEYDPVFHQLTMEVNAEGDTTRYELDDRGNTIRIINPLNDTTFNSYDSLGLLVKTINANGDSVLNFYNNMGNIDSTVNELGYVTKYEYALAGNMIAEIDPLDNRTEFEYDNNGRMKLTRDPLGNETEYIYDPSIAGGGCCGNATNDLLLAVINPAGDTTWYDYDEMGRRISVTNPEGNTSYTEYDSEGNITRQIDAEGRWISFGYDKAGNLTTVTDSLGRVTTHEYDSRDRKIATIDALGGITDYIYDGVSNLTHLINANGDTTSFTYDLMSRKISETDPLDRTEYYSYNPLGLIDTLITAKSDTILYGYDKLGRLTAKNSPDDTLSYQYDAIGNPLQVDDVDSRLVLTYNPNGQMETVTTGDMSNPDNIQPVTMIEYQYDEAGRKSAMIDPSSDTTYYHYNVNGELDTLIAPGGEYFEFVRDNNGRVTGFTRPNGTTTSYDYDASGNLLSIVHRNGLTLIDSLVYSYNGVSNIIMKTDESDTSAYGYDSLDQVITADYSDISVTDEFFTYDSVGNRLTSHLSTQYGYDEANQINGDDVYEYTFDANGNMIEKEDTLTSDRWEYTFDSGNRLTEVKKYDGGISPPSLEVSYSYDGLDRRIGKIVNSDTTVYVYDGTNMLNEYNGSGLQVAGYVNGLQIDQPLKVTRIGTDYYYHTDRLGSIISLTDTNGDVVQTYRYDSFGNITSTLSQDYFSPYAYTGREWDEDAGLYYYRARYYDAGLGRFISEDPIGLDAGDVNLFRYVGNNSINNNDPYGLYGNAFYNRSTFMLFCKFIGRQSGRGFGIVCGIASNKQQCYSCCEFSCNTAHFVSKLFRFLMKHNPAPSNPLPSGPEYDIFDEYYIEPGVKAAKKSCKISCKAKCRDKDKKKKICPIPIPIDNLDPKVNLPLNPISMPLTMPMPSPILM